MAGENGITKVHSVGALKSAIGEHWKHFPAAAVALQIIEAIEADHSPAQKWHTSDILILLDQSQLTADVVAALAILTQSEYAVFRAAAEFVDVDQQRYLLSSEAFQRVLDMDTLTHPSTGEELTQASAHVVPFYELETDLFSRGAVQ